MNTPSTYTNIPRWINDVIDIINQHFLSDLTQKVDQIMVTVSEIKSQSAALKVQAEASNALIASLATAVDAIQKKLDDAIAGGGGTSVAELQAIADDLTAVKTALDAQVVAEQAVLDDANSTGTPPVVTPPNPPVVQPPVTTPLLDPSGNPVLNADGTPATTTRTFNADGSFTDVSNVH